MHGKLTTCTKDAMQKVLEKLLLIFNSVPCLEICLPPCCDTCRTPAASGRAIVMKLVTQTMLLSFFEKL